MHRRSLLPLVFVSFAAFAFPASLSAGGSSAFGPFTIKVEIEGVTQGVFQAVEGLASTSAVVVRQEDSAMVEAPGALQGSRLILKRPYDPLLSGLWHWRQSVVDGNPQKRDGDIFIFNAAGQRVAHWVFRKGWPCRWEVPMLASSSQDPAVEIVEIVHSGLTLEYLGGS